MLAFAGALIGTTCLSGCLGAGGSIEYDPAIRNEPGTMTIDVAQTYSRERLINERAADVAWIDRLIAASEDPTKVTFKPTLLREMEEISAFSATLGVKYDPTAGLNYKRSNETGEIMQEIDVLKAKVALAQVKRDIELIDARMSAQTDPVNAGLGTLGTGGTVPAASSVTQPDTSAVAATVNTLIASVTARLDAEAKSVGATSVVSSPADDFKDRLAYRNMLKAARNAAGLDDLHDAGDNRLVRLNLHATVIPDPHNPRALGALQVKVDSGGTDAVLKYLVDWLAAVNASSEWRVDAGRFKPNSTLDELKDSGDFQESKIGTVRLLMPVLETQGGNKLDSDALLQRADWGTKDDADSVNFSTVTSSLPPDGSNAATVAASVCAPGAPASLYLAIADAREKSQALIRSADIAADKLKEAPPGVDVAAKVARAKVYQNQVLKLIHNVPGCADLERYSPVAMKWRVQSRKEFRDSQRIRVYDVGPREQAQQVSSMARSAQSLAMAVSLAAAAPSAGVAGNLGAGYRRDIMNRASTLDRVPEVVGYSVGGDQIFGWVIGPHATTDSKGRAMVRQEPKSLDLAVDLSIPAWWGGLELKVTRVWAPSPQALVDGALKIEGQEPVTIPVNLTAGAADYNSFTQFLIRDGKRPVSVGEVIGGPVNGCAATTLLLKGDNLWRAEKVLLLGVPLGREAFTIAPDMHGLIVTVPAVAAIPGESAYKQDNQVHVLTPLGEASNKFNYDATLSGDGCKAKAPAAAAAAAGDAVTVTNADPVSFTVPSLVRINVDGTNLGKVDLVKLGGRKGTITDLAADGTSFTAEFSRDITEGIDEGNAKLEFFTKKKPVGIAQTIRINRN